MDVSIIIVNYNTKQLTRQCIDSVFEKTQGVDFEVIIVDNASVDGSRDVFENDSRIKYIYSQENLGFGRANNLGYESSNGEYIFLLNSDTYLKNNAIFLLWSELRKANALNDIACIGSMLEDADGNLNISFGRFTTIRDEILSNSIRPFIRRLLPQRKIYNSFNKGAEYQEGSLFDVDYISGADLMIRRDVVKLYGLFDSDFFLYCEEMEMQHRYMKAGLRRVITKIPKIVHLEGSSYKKNKENLEKNAVIQKSHILYMKKTRSSLVYIWFCTLFLLICIPSRMIWILCGNDIKGGMIYIKLLIKSLLCPKRS